MNIDQDGKNFIQSFEGYRKFPYRDPIGILTVGIGHKILPGEDYSAGLTLLEADDLLMADLAPVEAMINTLSPQCNQNQFNALCSFGFNLGIGERQMMLAHGFSEIPFQVPKWNKAHMNGQLVEIAGLTRRRQAEVALFKS